MTIAAPATNQQATLLPCERKVEGFTRTCQHERNTYSITQSGQLICLRSAGLARSQGAVCCFHRRVAAIVQARNPLPNARQRGAEGTAERARGEARPVLIAARAMTHWSCANTKHQMGTQNAQCLSRAQRQAQAPMRTHSATERQSCVWHLARVRVLRRISALVGYRGMFSGLVRSLPMVSALDKLPRQHLHWRVAQSDRRRCSHVVGYRPRGRACACRAPCCSPVRGAHCRRSTNRP